MGERLTYVLPSEVCLLGSLLLGLIICLIDRARSCTAVFREQKEIVELSSSVTRLKRSQSIAGLLAGDKEERPAHWSMKSKDTGKVLLCCSNMAIVIWLCLQIRPLISMNSIDNTSLECRSDWTSTNMV